MDREKFVGVLEEKKAKGELGEPGFNCWSWCVKEAKKNGEWTLIRDEVGNYEQPIEGCRCLPAQGSGKESYNSC